MTFVNLIKTLAFCVAFVFDLASCAGQATTSSFIPQTKDEKELARLTKLMSSASETGDTAAYITYIHPDFLITYSRCSQNSYGRFATKNQVISQWGKSSSAGTSTPTIYRIQVNGRTGIVHSFIADQSVGSDGKQEIAHSWVTDIWVKRKGRWYWFSAHESLLNNQ